MVIAEWFHFYKRVQSSTESIAEFVADLRRLSIHCEFGTFLNEAQRDSFVCGVEDQHIQKKMLAEDGLTMARAFGIAQGMEATAKNSKELHQDVSPTLMVTLQELRDESTQEEVLLSLRTLSRGKGLQVPRGHLSQLW